MKLLLSQLLEEIEAITPEQIERAHGHLKPLKEGEEPLHSMAGEVDVQKLWTLTGEYERRAAAETFRAKFDVATDQAKLEAACEICRLQNVENVLREYFWLELRRIHPDLYKAGAIAFRSGWTVTTAERSPMQLFEEALGASLPALLVKLQKGPPPDEDDEEEEEVVQ